MMINVDGAGVQKSVREFVTPLVSRRTRSYACKHCVFFICFGAFCFLNCFHVSHNCLTIGNLFRVFVILSNGFPQIPSKKRTFQVFRSCHESRISNEFGHSLKTSCSSFITHCATSHFTLNAKYLNGFGHCLFKNFAHPSSALDRKPVVPPVLPVLQSCGLQPAWLLVQGSLFHWEAPDLQNPPCCSQRPAC